MNDRNGIRILLACRHGILKPKVFSSLLVLYGSAFSGRKLGVLITRRCLVSKTYP